MSYNVSTEDYLFYLQEYLQGETGRTRLTNGIIADLDSGVSIERLSDRMQSLQILYNVAADQMTGLFEIDALRQENKEEEDDQIVK